MKYGESIPILQHFVSMNRHYNSILAGILYYRIGFRLSQSRLSVFDQNRKDHNGSNEQHQDLGSRAKLKDPLHCFVQELNHKVDEVYWCKTT